MDNTPSETEETPDFILLFKRYVREHERRPQSVHKFATAMEFDPALFHKHYNALPALEKAVWIDLFTQTINRLDKSAEYDSFCAREKLLALHFTWVETLKADAGYVRPAIHSYAGPIGDLPVTPPSFVLAMKAPFKAWSKNLIDEALASGEILERPPLSNRYHNALWLQFLSTILVWLKDDSNNWETTDDAIEKSVNLGFDLMGRNPVDEALDLAKTLFRVFGP